jgi:hypothetical protein
MHCSGYWWSYETCNLTLNIVVTPSIGIEDDEEESSGLDRQIYSPDSGRDRERCCGRKGEVRIDLRECPPDETRAVLAVEFVVESPAIESLRMEEIRAEE